MDFDLNEEQEVLRTSGFYHSFIFAVCLFVPRIVATHS